MHVRFSMCLGLPVTDDETGDTIGFIDGILIHPDTGKVEGFRTRSGGFFHTTELFLPSVDILRFGLRMTVRGHDALSSLDDFVRLRPLIEDPRPVLSQKIWTDAGTYIGVCKDVQFDTESYMVEWLFPKKWGRWKTPLPATQILEVRKDMIIVKDTTAITAKEEEGKVNLMEGMPEAV